MSEKTTNNPANWLAGLTAIYACLKLLGVIDWSWWWVFSPILIPLGFALGLMLLYVVATLFLLFARWAHS